MKHLVKLTFGIAAAILLAAASASATVIADWTFETSLPATTGPFSPETGSGTGTASGGSVYSTPAGNFSTHSWSANGWDIGDYWQFQVDTTGYLDIVVDWDQTGSGTGPRDFIFQYSTDNSTYTQFGSSLTILLNTSPPWGATTGSTKYHYTMDLSTISAVEGASAVYFRITDNSNTAINGAGVGTGGTDRVDNFTVTTSVPEPSTVMLVAFGLAGSLLAIRRRRS